MAVTATTLGIIGTGLAVAGAAANVLSANTKINEQITENTQAVSEYSAESLAAQENASANMSDIAAANVYNVGQTVTSATKAVGTLRSTQGYSGVRGNSPLLALKEQQSESTSAINESIRSGNASLYSAGREMSILTSSYQRKIAQLQSDNDYLNKNRTGSLLLSGISGLGNIFQSMTSWL